MKSLNSTTIDAPLTRVLDTGSHNRTGEVLRALSSFKTEFIWVGFLSALVNLLMLAPTLYMLQVYDRVMISQNALTLVSVSLITLLAFGVIAAAEWTRSKVLVYAGMRLDERLSTRVFNASFEAHLSRSQVTGQSPARAFNDLLQVRQFLTGQGIFAFFDLPWAPIYIIVMFLLHPFLGWLSIAFALVQMALAWWGHRQSVSPSEAAQTSLLESQQFLQGKLRNSEVVEAMGMANHLKRGWWERHSQWNHDADHAQHVAHRLSAISKFVRYVQQSASLGAGALLVIDGQLSPGAMIAANVLMSRALAPIDMVVSTWKGSITAFEAFQRLSRLLDAHPDRSDQAQRSAPKGLVELSGVTAFVPATEKATEKIILRDVSFRVQPGRVLAVMGPSGSGKSTLARVILGIWGSVRGDVRLDGYPLESWDRMALGPSIGYLPQDVELFDGTIAENISRFAEIDPQAVIKAAQMTGLHEMILRFPRGYDTPMGEAGSLLSGGQRQRIALARAVYGQPPLVVLDEPNANLDDAGEAALAKSVYELKQLGSTVIIISHRPSALSQADELLILQAGQVTAHGPRDAVLARMRATAAATPPASSQSAPASAADSPAVASTASDPIQPSSV